MQAASEAQKSAIGKLKWCRTRNFLQSFFLLIQLIIKSEPFGSSRNIFIKFYSDGLKFSMSRGEWGFYHNSAWAGWIRFANIILKGKRWFLSFTNRNILQVFDKPKLGGPW